MPGRILIVAMLGARLIASGESEPRAGVWETRLDVGGKPQHLRLILTIFKGELGTASPRVIIQGSIRSRPQSTLSTVASTWELVRSCGYLAEPQIQLAGNHLVFQCSSGSLPQPAGQQSQDVSGFDGQFDQSYTRLSGTLRLGDDKISVRFTRPEESDATPLAGHWAASGWGQTCILHVYSGSATIDIYSSEQAIFGQSVAIAKLADGRFDVSWSDIGPHSFIGSVDVERRSFDGHWSGRGFLCSENGPQGLFTRYGIK